MTPQVFKAKVAEHQLLSGSFQYLHLELLTPHRIEFLAGQYVILTVDPAKGIRRDYSIASPPSMDHAIDLLVDIKPGGEGSRYLGNLKPGDDVEFQGPFGNFTVSEPSTELIFVATGSGISPLRSMIIDEVVTKRTTEKVRLWWGMRFAQDCFWIEDFDELEEENPTFEWDLILSKPPDDWPLHAGHVTPHVLHYVQDKAKGQGLRDKGNSEIPSAFDPRPLSFYLCGSRLMIEGVSTELAKLGITAEQIHSEKFY